MFGLFKCPFHVVSYFSTSQRGSTTNYLEAGYAAGGKTHHIIAAAAAGGDAETGRRLWNYGNELIESEAYCWQIQRMHRLRTLQTAGCRWQAGDAKKKR